jgi:predicted nucleic acid-binding protein
MGAPCFVDTNIWLYAFIESDDDPRSGQARQLLRSSTPVISTQVINEVCVNALKRALLTETDIQELIRSFYNKYAVIEMNEDILLAASRLRQRYSMSYWDSLVVSCALAAGTNVLYSEDFQHDQLIDGQLRILNPFRDR